jgi:hypothetical protein
MSSNARGVAIAAYPDEPFMHIYGDGTLITGHRSPSASETARLLIEAVGR